MKPAVSAKKLGTLILSVLLLQPLAAPGSQADGSRAPNAIPAITPNALKNWGILNAVSKSHIQAVDAWKITEGSDKIVVAVIDTGIDSNHPDLKNQLWKSPTSKRVFGWDFSANSPNPSDPHGHGTHVSGIIGGQINLDRGAAGVAPKVSLMPVRYFTPAANSESLNLQNTVKAIQYAIANGAQIINYSGGGREFSPEEKAAIEEAERRGILFVAAAGNDHKDIDSEDYSYYPAAYNLSNMITVGANNINNQLLSSSNWGRNSVDVVAPGDQIYSTDRGGGYRVMSGTSQATAFVSGIAALLLSKDPSLNPQQLREIILKSVDKFPQFVDKTRSGGRVNAFAALKLLETLKSKPESAKLLAQSPTFLPTRGSAAEPLSREMDVALLLERTWLPDRRTFASAVLIVLAFPPWDLSFLAWFALVPWLLALESAAPSRRSSLREGFWLGFLMSLLGFFWVAKVIQNYGQLPWAVAIAGWLIFCCFNQLQFLVFALATRSWFGRSTISSASLLGIAALYTAIDWWFPKLFIDSLGHSTWNLPWLRQAADLGGVWILTFAILTANLSLYRFWKEKPPTTRARLRSLAPGLLTLALLMAYGIPRLHQVRSLEQNPSDHVDVAVIQANIGDMEKFAAKQGFYEAGNTIVTTYLELSRQALSLSPRPEILIWPETAYPSKFRHPESVIEAYRDQSLEQLARSQQVSLVFGGYDSEHGKEFNSLFALSPHQPAPGATDLQIYHKHVLLMFGEYIPGQDLIPAIGERFPQVGNFGRGPGASVLQLARRDPARAAVPVTPIICYEALFSDYLLEGKRLGAKAIVNVTNDSWFGRFGEPQLHFALTVFRSLETRLPQIRSTNTGISALILPSGDLIDPTGTFEEKILSYRVPLLSPITTVIDLTHGAFGWVIMVLGVLYGVMGLRKPE